MSAIEVRHVHVTVTCLLVAICRYVSDRGQTCARDCNLFVSSDMSLSAIEVRHVHVTVTCLLVAICRYVSDRGQTCARDCNLLVSSDMSLCQR
jgi:hypothetical protein